MAAIAAVKQGSEISIAVQKIGAWNMRYGIGSLARRWIGEFVPDVYQHTLPDVVREFPGLDQMRKVHITLFGRSNRQQVFGPDWSIATQKLVSRDRVA